MIFVNCLLKCSAFCLSVMPVLLSKVMVMLGVCGGFLCAMPFKVFQSVSVFALWSQLSVRCCFQSASLWFCISSSMFVFFCARSGSLGFCCPVVFRCFIMFLICSGSSLCVWCIFTFGIWCLSAASMALVSIFVEVSAFYGVSVFASVCSIFCVNSCQFALLWFV